MLASMLKKALGVMSGVFALGCTTMTVVAIGDLIGGGSATSNSVLVGLVVFFGGLTAFSGIGAARLLRSPASATTTTTMGSTVPPVVNVAGIDIALEARILGMAAQHAGRVTATEVALGCGVSMDAAAAALDQLCVRGHADLAVTPDGAAVYVVKGFLSDHEKQQAEELVVG
jgi:hypothetical protein